MILLIKPNHKYRLAFTCKIRKYAQTYFKKPPNDTKQVDKFNQDGLIKNEKCAAPLEGDKSQTKPIYN